MHTYRAVTDITLVRDSPNGARLDSPAGKRSPEPLRLSELANRDTLNVDVVYRDLSDPAIIHQERVVPAFPTDWALKNHTSLSPVVDTTSMSYATADWDRSAHGRVPDYGKDKDVGRERDMYRDRGGPAPPPRTPRKFGVGALAELSMSLNTGASIHANARIRAHVHTESHVPSRGYL
jgi:hypothetical protein